jgi:hypothetical protein
MLDPLYLYRTLRAAQSGQYPPVPISRLQRGGAVDTRHVTYDGHPFPISVFPEARININTNATNINTAYEEATDFTALGGSIKNPCFIMKYTVATRSVVLVSLRKNGVSFTDGYTNMRAVVEIAYELAAQYFKAVRFYFTDNSYVDCSGDEPILGVNIDNDAMTNANEYDVPESAKIRLANWSFLTTGRTWYESILPVRCIPMDRVVRGSIESWRTKVQTNRWRDVAGPLLDMFDTSGIDIDAPGSAMAVLTRVKQSRAYCGVIAANLRELRIRSGVTRSLFSKDWYAVIPQSSTVAFRPRPRIVLRARLRRTHRQRTSSRRTTQHRRTVER